MYFENDSSDDKTYKGIKPNPKGYRFDNRFNIEFNKEEKTFYITDNPNYVKIYNNAISNFSCIVGRNGSGKTTFLELLITNIAWGITKYQPSEMKSIYYNTNENGNFEFYLQHYIRLDIEYKIKYNDIEIKHNRKSIPDDSKFIFHSLSPFDKIFYSISIPLKENPSRIKPFIRQMKYIGNQNIFKNDPKHEIQTITNLINLFSTPDFSKPFEDTLKYKFSKININVDFNKELNNWNHIDSVNENVILIQNNINEKLKNYANINKYPLLVIFNNCLEEDKLAFFKFLMLNLTYSIENYEDYLLKIVLDNFDFNKIESNISNLNNFLNLISFNEVVENYKINLFILKSNILKIEKFKNYTFVNDFELLNELYQDKELIEQILTLGTKSIEQISTIKNLSNLIYLIRKLKNKNYLEFELYLLKEEQEINYFYLSSGEKTMISYFVNLSNSIIDFNEIEDKTFIILIDEVELHLHPKWQINFIEYMNNFFKPNNKNMKFQFIIATHSPFILSDISEEQIIYINEEDKVENEFNTFGANIYDIFEKGFFLENSIGLCSQNFIKKISDEFHYFKALNDAKNYNDFFLLRSFKEENYIDFNNKKEEDKILLESELKNLKESILNYKYIINTNNKYILIESVEKAINIIGEPTIKNHLLGLYYTLKEIEINEN